MTSLSRLLVAREKKGGNDEIIPQRDTASIKAALDNSKCSCVNIYSLAVGASAVALRSVAVERLRDAFATNNRLSGILPFADILVRNRIDVFSPQLPSIELAVVDQLIQSSSRVRNCTS